MLLGTIIKVSAKQIEITPMVEVLEEARAPEFTLPTQNGELVGLSDFLGNKVVLYFFVKDDTPGCTREACDFRDSLAAFERSGAVVIGVSPDNTTSHQSFSQKYRLPFTLVSDEGAVVATQYGVYKRRVLYGRSFLGIERSTFVIGKDGRIQQMYRRVKVDGHIQALLASLAGADIT